MVIIRENTSDISCSELERAVLPAGLLLPPIPPSPTSIYKLLLALMQSADTRLFTFILPKPSTQKSEHLIVTISHF